MKTCEKRPDTQNAFRERMEDQCHEIEQYRLATLKIEGRLLSEDEAGLEWIERHAEDFARGEYEPPDSAQ